MGIQVWNLISGPEGHAYSQISNRRLFHHSIVAIINWSSQLYIHKARFSMKTDFRLQMLGQSARSNLILYDFLAHVGCSINALKQMTKAIFPIIYRTSYVVMVNNYVWERDEEGKSLKYFGLLLLYYYYFATNECN